MKNLLLAIICTTFCLSLFAQNKVFDVRDPAMLTLIDTNARIEKIAMGFGFLEGPVWVKPGHLLVSDLIANAIFSVSANGKVERYIATAGYSGTDTASISDHYGPDGMAIDNNGNVIVCQHGDHAIAAITPNRKLKTIVDSYEGKALNSPDDIAIARNGDIYFTDPPYVFKHLDKDPLKQQKDNGVYLWKNGQLTLLINEYRFPNGIALSPDEKFVYVCSYGEKEWLKRYERQADGKLVNGRVLAQINGDGLKVDKLGNVYLCNWQGLHIFSPEGEKLGVIHFPESITNFTWGDADKRTAYVVAATNIYKFRTIIAGQ